MKINIQFMKIVVVFCIAYVVYLTERSMMICENIGVSPETVYVTAVAFFGTELALNMAKKIMDKRKKGSVKDECTEVQS